MAARLSSGDLHQFHWLAVAIVAHPCGFETKLASDMRLEEQTMHSLYAATEEVEHLIFIMRFGYSFFFSVHPLDFFLREQFFYITLNARANQPIQRRMNDLRN